MERKHIVAWMYILTWLYAKYLWRNLVTQKDRGGARCALKKEWEDIFHSMPTILLCSVSSFQFSRSVLFNSLQPHGCQASLYITNSWSLLKLMSIESVMPSNHLILCRLLLLLPSIFPSIRVFSSESALHNRWPKYWSFSFSISPSNEYSGLISFRFGLVWYPCSPRDSHESSPTPQFKSVHSLELSLLCGPTLTSVHDYWKKP